MFSRSVGSAVGVAVFGAVVNSYVSSRLDSSDPDIQHVSARILEPAIHDVFLVTVFITLALLVVGFLMPSRVTEPDATPAAEPAADAERDVVA